MIKGNNLFSALLIVILLIGGNFAFAKISLSPTKVPVPAKNSEKSNYIIVDSCDEYSQGPKSHQGFCECYGDPYYYCAYFPKLSPHHANKNRVEFTVPFSFSGKKDDQGVYRVIYQQNQ